MTKAVVAFLRTFYSRRSAQLVLVGLATLLLGTLGVARASADFGLSGFDVNAHSGPEAGIYSQAGGHSYDIATDIPFNSHLSTEGIFEELFGPAPTPDSPVKDVLVDVPPGLIGNPLVLPTCSVAELAEGAISYPPGCPIPSQVGVIYLDDGGRKFGVPLFNLSPPHGMPARFGFNFAGNVIFIDAAVRGQGANLHIALDSTGISEALPLVGVKVVFWGTPADSLHDGDRCLTIGIITDTLRPPGEPERTVSPHLCSDPHSVSGLGRPVPFITLPTFCTAVGVGIRFDIATDSWDEPGVFDLAHVLTHEAPAYPEALGTTERGTENCDVVPSNPTIALQPTGQSAESPTGLDVALNIPNDGLLNPSGIAQAALKKVVVKLPEGMSLNPSQGEGLGVCTPADFAKETVVSKPGEGCPSSAKLGGVNVETPLLDHSLSGAIYLAQPDNVRTSAPGAENPFDSLVALYIVIKDPISGVNIKLVGKVEGDPNTGRLISTFDNLPQVPFSAFTLHFREGARSPLVSPPTCGAYTTQTEFTPYSNPEATVHDSSSFEVTSGIGGGPCPKGGAPPFTPKLDAGSINSNAGSFSPFYVRMFRTDEQQEITNFSADLPPGVAGVLSGIPKCSDARLATMAQETGVEAQNNPACPAASQVGRSLVGYGVGTVLSYAPGKVYLAGPYHGTPVSIATVAPATIGPFDLGTVVVRSAFRVDPETAQVHIDSKGSDPIPHILRGFPLHLRDIRVYLDRSNFTFNPTNCNPMSVQALMTGAGTILGDARDDVKLPITEPFQVSNCSLLPFKPVLTLKLKGGTHRGDFPALHSVLRGRPGDANLRRAVVTLPHSEFLEQGHIKTVCTRVQFAAEDCPAGSIYGHVVATTPILDNPLKGNVYLRSNGGERLLPDLVIALRGEITADAVGHVDSIKGGRIRTSFETIPDTPVTKLVLDMQGGQKGLFVNSRNLCLRLAKTEVQFTGQNGKAEQLRPVMENSCKRQRRHPKRAR